MNIFWQDVRYGLRTLRGAPGFAIIALLSLAIGIGANTAIFSTVNAVLLRPLPYKDAGRLVILWNRSPGLGITEDWFSTAQYFDIKTGSTVFEDVAILIGGNENLTGDGEPERVGTLRVSSNLLPMLGATAASGRLFVAGDDTKGAAGTAILSYGMWSRRYGLDPHVIGRSLTIDGKTFQVVGTLPRSFSLPRETVPTLGGAEDAEILLTLPLSPGAAQDRDHEDFNIVGKLKPNVRVQQAQAEMNRITARLRRDFPEHYPPTGGLTFGVVSLSDQVVGDTRFALWMLLGAVGLVLLIACANVANLQLSRALERRTEFAVRLAIGATASRIMRQLLTESFLLSICGAGAGVLLAMVSLRWVRVLGPGSVPRLSEIHVDGRVLLFTLVIAAVSATIFGLAPALRAAHFDVYSALKDGTRASAGAGSMWGRGQNLRKVLVVSELALSILLLIGASLLIRSFARLQNVPPGFNAKNVLTFELTMNGLRYKDGPTVLQSYKQLNEALENIPGVVASGAITSLPLSQMYAWGPLVVEGSAPPPGQNFINADERIVSGHYFQAMEIPLREGRFFNQTDTQTSQLVAIVDEHMVNDLWANQDAVGKRFHLGGLADKNPWITVVGVAGRIKQYALDDDSRIAFYLPQPQFITREMNVVVRSKGGPQNLSSAVREQVKILDRDLPIFRVKTMERRVQESLARRKFSASLLALFAALAFVLAIVGIYGVIAHLVSQGTREIGIRVALGASRRSIIQLIVRHGMILATMGVMIGLLGGFALERVMRTMLFGIGAMDSFTFFFVPLLLMVVALVATYIPARRAARIAPAVSLRSE